MTATTEITEAEEARRGELIAKALRLKRDREYPDRYPTDWGTKTNLGLYRMLKRIVEDGE